MFNQRYSRFSPLFTLALFSLLPALASGADKPSVKPGAWEMTTSSSMAGMAMPADAMASIPEAQRARIMAAMGARAGKTRTTTHKYCLTQKEIDENMVMKDKDDDSRCKSKIISRTAKSMIMEQNCPAPEARTARMAMQFPSSEAMQGTIDMSRPDGFKAHIEMKSRWLGASCAGLKD